MSARPEFEKMSWASVAKYIFSTIQAICPIRPKNRMENQSLPLIFEVFCMVLCPFRYFLRSDHSIFCGSGQKLSAEPLYRAFPAVARARRNAGVLQVIRISAIVDGYVLRRIFMRSLRSLVGTRSFYQRLLSVMIHIKAMRHQLAICDIPQS